MSPKHTAGKKMLEDFAPKLAQLTDEVRIDDVWEGKELSKEMFS